MRGILTENKNFIKLSAYYKEEASIEKELNDFSISDEKKEKLEKRLRYLKREISELRVALEDEIKVS